MQKVLVVGSEGREAAIVWKLAQSLDTKVYCAPGNAGIEDSATCIPIPAIDVKELLAFAVSERIDLTIVGPEAPLVAGIVDRFHKENLLICGPTATAARTEGSKAWFKRLLARHNIPTAPFEIFDDKDQAFAYVRKRGARAIVIKADGLMGGKGVILPDTLPEAANVLEKFMIKGSPGEVVVIEDRLVGLERSVIAITDSRAWYVLPFTQDYKRVGDGDVGPNTGGMGAHTLILSYKEQMELGHIIGRVVWALASESCTYSGFIYLGFMITVSGPKVLECNCRLGDPETQVILPSINGDFAALCTAVARGDLRRVQPPTQMKHALCVVLASAEYPESSDCDDTIVGLENARETGALLFHAGTAERNGRIRTNKSGRVLNSVGIGDSTCRSTTNRLAGAEEIQFPGVKYRRDIGAGVI